MTSDHFPLHVCFPDATALFSRRVKTVDEIAERCLVALDTNVLLAPYSLGDKDISEIEKTYLKLSTDGRIFIPAQVAREFARNRANKIGEIVKTILDQISRLGNSMPTQFTFLKSIPEYENAIEISKIIEEQQKNLSKKLKCVIDRIRTWDNTDPVWDMYRKVFANCVEEITKEDQDKIPRELKFRSDHKIPPGFKDDHKHDGGSGDLIIWKTLIKVAEHRKSDLIFVTMDQKGDWWTQAAGGPLFPRRELLEEFASCTGGKSIQFLRFSDFLERFGVETSVVEKVQEVESEEARSVISNDENEPATIRENFSPYEAEIVNRMSYLKRRLSAKLYSLRRYLQQGRTDKIQLVSEEIRHLKSEIFILLSVIEPGKEQESLMIIIYDISQKHK
ncbi:PIN domain-containing protein [Salinarimonas soli]|uniref:PIN like domain-containing protein n=1 Tax=Salinarimonas soli TaxID=1638099 RepID=A0A5B2VBQ7_9HYPH|nr:PIN domain-containing protein [Salinarimonas soli]KAA2236178.1 hypothetical protein F0L46_15820 [Salinarimonas soli]